MIVQPVTPLIPDGIPPHFRPTTITIFWPGLMFQKPVPIAIKGIITPRQILVLDVIRLILTNRQIPPYHLPVSQHMRNLPFAECMGSFNFQSYCGLSTHRSHTTVACAKCHTTGYINTPNTCAGCHTNDYNQTTNPNHTTSLFPKTCETCHTPSAWVPSTFNHTSVYPLTGAHNTVACNLCHASGYTNTPNTCVRLSSERL